LAGAAAFGGPAEQNDRGVVLGEQRVRSIIAGARCAAPCWRWRRA